MPAWRTPPTRSARRAGRSPRAAGGRCTPPLLAGLLAAAAVTGGLAWVLSGVRDRWDRQFAALRADHPLRDAADEAAVAAGVGVFLAAWVLAVARLRPPNAPPP